MTRARHPAGASRVERHKSRHHERSTRQHRKNPCPHGPRVLDVYTDLFGEFVKYPKKRHNRWTAELRWSEVDVDTDGFPIQVQGYDVVVERTANSIDWFIHSKHHVPAKQDTDPDEEVQHVVHHINGQQAYRYKVRARTKTCEAEFSDWFDLGPPNDGPPAPNDVIIRRDEVGIKLTWSVDPDLDDDRDFIEDISHFITELWLHDEFDDGHEFAFTGDASDDKITISSHGFANGDALSLHRTIGGANIPGGLKPWRCYYVRDVTTNTFKLAFRPGGAAINLTSNGDGTAHWGLVRTGRHGHAHEHVFHIQPDDFDEDQRFYGRVRSVSSDGSKSAFIPATGVASGGNDDPMATPAGRRPAWPRRNFIGNFIGAVTEGVVNIPNRVDDDYIVRRVTAAFNHSGDDDTKFDVKVNGASWLFDLDPSKMTTLDSGDHDASSKQLVNPYLERGDHLRVDVYQVAATPPRNGTVVVVADRLDDGSTDDSGGGGDEEGESS